MELLGEAWWGTNMLQKRWDEHHPGEVLMVFGAMYDKSVNFEDRAVVMRPMNIKWIEENEGLRLSLEKKELLQRRLFQAMGDLTEYAQT